MLHICRRMKRSACLICSCMNRFMTHLRIYVKRRSSRLSDPPALIYQTALTTKSTPRPAFSSQLCSKTAHPLPRVNDYKISTNGLRSRADLHHSLLFFVSVAETWDWIRREVFLCRYANGPVFCCSGPSQLAHRAPCSAERKRSSSSVCHSVTQHYSYVSLPHCLSFFTFGGKNRQSSPSFHLEKYFPRAGSCL